MNRNVTKHVAVALLLFALMLVATACSIMFGTKDIAIIDVWQAFTQFDADNVDHQIIVTGRLPRALAVLAVGAFLAVAGALMQGITRNFLASPSIMGVTDGSAFFITIALVYFPTMTSFQLVGLSMVGSLVGGSLVFLFASFIKNGLSPVRLAIIGTVIGTFLSSIATAIAMYNQESQTVSLWYNSKLPSVQMEMVMLCVPIGFIGLLIALLLANGVTITALGEDVAVSLGQKTKWMKVMSMLAVAILTGTAVALVGKIGFVGLIVPHIVRFFVGVDYRHILPFSALFGALFLSMCDLLSRYVNAPFETPIGVVTACIGVPCFLYLIRRKGGEKYAA